MNEVCAVIVTYNRKHLLLRALAAVAAQSGEPVHMLIVDNASTDGTRALLKESGWLARPEVDYLALSENLGGAGGFCHGIAEACRRGFSWIWLMDDDGYPAPDCLKKMQIHARKDRFLGPLVLDEQCPHRLCWPLKTSQSLKTVAAARAQSREGLIWGSVIAFNGILLSSELVKQIGLPKEEYFIWGDDIEYTWRAQKAGAVVASVADAFFFHPRAPQVATPMLWGQARFNDSDAKLKIYCLCRNNTANLKRYRGLAFALAFILKVGWFYTFTRPNATKLRLALGACIHGLRGDFRHHRQWL